MSWLSSWLGLTPATPTPDADGALIRAAGLQLRRRAFQLHIDTLEVQPGSVVGLVGPNGSGKTTLMEALVGLRPIHAGTVRVVGLDPRRSGAQIRETVAITSATRPLPAMRVGTLLDRVAPYYPTWDAELAQSLVERFSVDLLARVPNLSTGQRARLRLVLALASRPRVVLLDEPGLGLDLSQRRALFTSVLEVVQDPERSVVISSHQLEDLERLADHLVVLAGGRCVRQGPIEDLVGDGQTLEEALLRWGAA
jgi:ABC-2 type transport system ATP-binding protein